MLVLHAGHRRGDLALLPEATAVRFAAGGEVDQVPELGLQRRETSARVRKNAARVRVWGEWAAVVAKWWHR